MLESFPCPACGCAAYHPGDLRQNERGGIFAGYINEHGLVCHACYQRKRRAARKVANSVACITCGVLFSPVRADAKFCA